MTRLIWVYTACKGQFVTVLGLITVPVFEGGNQARKYKEKKNNVYGSSATSYAQVKFCVGEFKWGKTPLEDESRSGCLLIRVFSDVLVAFLCIDICH